MADIKALDQVGKKWGRVTPGRTEDYSQGVKSPRRDWEGATKGAVTAYNEGVQEAINQKSFEKGVGEAGTAKWQRKAVSVGVDRWGPGVRAAMSDYESGFAPYHATIAALDLPARGPKGDPKNTERVAAIAKALHQTKVSGGK